MPPIVSKLELYEQGVRLAQSFLAANKLVQPNFHTYDDAPLSYGNHLATFKRTAPLQGKATGWYDNRNIFVNLKACAWPREAPAFQSWSYPGYKIDRTPVGVVAHETGHHVDFELRKKGIFTPELQMEWRKMTTRKRKDCKRVTGYEPIPVESFAESMRLFILNPHLLEKGILERYEFLTLKLNLKPSETRNFDAVLNNHPAYVAQAEKWIVKKR